MVRVHSPLVVLSDIGFTRVIRLAKIEFVAHYSHRQILTFHLVKAIDPVFDIEECFMTSEVKDYDGAISILEET